jgi:hypothetical protein
MDLTKTLHSEGTEIYLGSVSDTLRIEEMKCWKRNQNKQSKARRRRTQMVF